MRGFGLGDAGPVGLLGVTVSAGAGDVDGATGCEFPPEAASGYRSSGALVEGFAAGPALVFAPIDAAVPLALLLGAAVFVDIADTEGAPVVAFTVGHGSRPAAEHEPAPGTCMLSAVARIEALSAA